MRLLLASLVLVASYASASPVNKSFDSEVCNHFYHNSFKITFFSFQASNARVTREKVPNALIKETELRPVRNLTALIQMYVRIEVERAIDKLVTSQNFTKMLEEEIRLKILNETAPWKPPKKVKPHQIYYIRRRPEFIPRHPFVLGGPEDSSFYTPKKFLSRVVRDVDSVDVKETGQLLDALPANLDEEGRGFLSSITATANSAQTNIRNWLSSLHPIFSSIPSVSIVKKTYYLPSLSING